MYATIRNYAGNPGFADALAARKDEVLQLLSPIAGFRAYYLVRSADGTTSITITDDAAGGEASSQAAAEWISQNMPDAGGGSPQIMSGDVVISS
jgi:heme-degrading monooxygenase HmoA